MKRLAVILTLFLAGSYPISALETSDRQAITAQYQAWAKAYRDNNANALLAVLAPEFQIVTSTGKRISRAKYKSSLLARKTGPAHYTIVPNKIRVRGRRARVWSKEKLEEDGAIHSHKYLDLWAKQGGRWLMTRSITLGED